MVRAYVLVEMTAGYSRTLADALTKSSFITDVDRATGPYDVIAVVEAYDVNEISKIVSAEIHTVPGVTRTTTCVALGG